MDDSDNDGNDGDADTGDDNITTPVDGTDDDSGDGTADNSDDASDLNDVQSDSEIFGMSPLIVYAVVGLIVAGLLSVLLLRGRGGQADASAFAAQEKAYGAAPALAAHDPTITAEQLAYEQQLVASGYPADYARSYADQHFRPWLKN